MGVTPGLQPGDAGFNSPRRDQMALSSNRPGTRILNPEIRVRIPEASPLSRLKWSLNVPVAEAAAEAA